MLHDFYAFLDPVLIFVFRLPADPLLGFLLGLTWVSLIATVIGELCMAGAYFANGRHFAKLNRDMVDNQNLSVRALARKDKTSYKACNTMANDAFGRSFFAGIALFASSIWPAFLAMGWLTFRFAPVQFNVPVIGEVTPIFFFIPVYIIVRILFHRAKPWLPLFRTIKRKIKENEAGEELISFADIVHESEAARAARNDAGATGTPAAPETPAAEPPADAGPRA
ncbi:MAG: hypothetical protein AB7D57_02010 [Desulfovibrionaceae bacterium]